MGFEAESKNRGRAEKSRMKKESQVNELVPPMSVSNPAAYKAMLDKQIAKNVKVKTALGNKKHKDHKKAKSLYQRFMDKFKKKKGDKPKKAAPKKQSKSDTDFYKRQFTGEGFADKLTKKMKKHKGTKVKKESTTSWQKSLKNAMELDKKNMLSKKDKATLQKIAKLMKNANIKEGFGGQLKGSDKKKFEKARKENAEQLGYTLTGTSDVKIQVNESVNEDHHWSIEPSGIMAKINKIVQDKQHAKIGGVLVDLFSAGIMMQIYDRVNDKNKEKMNKGNIRQVQVVLNKVMKHNKVKP